MCALICGEPDGPQDHQHSPREFVRSRQQPSTTCERRPTTISDGGALPVVGLWRLQATCRGINRWPRRSALWAVLVITCIITRRIRGHINDRTMPMQPRKHIRGIQGHASMECVYMYMSPFSCIASDTSYKTMHASQFARMHAPYRQDD